MVRYSAGSAPALVLIAIFRVSSIEVTRPDCSSRRARIHGAVLMGGVAGRHDPAILRKNEGGHPAWARDSGLVTTWEVEDQIAWLCDGYALRRVRRFEPLGFCAMAPDLRGWRSLPPAGRVDSRITALSERPEAETAIRLATLA
jgi:hypothetical protein